MGYLYELAKATTRAVAAEKVKAVAERVLGRTCGVDLDAVYTSNASGYMWGDFFRLKIKIIWGTSGLTEFYLYEFPYNCSYLCIGRLDGKVGLTLEIAEEIARWLRYTVVFASTTSYNTDITAGLKLKNYKLLMSNYNIHSGNYVEIYILSLTKSLCTYSLGGTFVINPIDSNTPLELSDEVEEEEEENGAIEYEADEDDEEYDDQEESDEEEEDDDV